MENLLKIVGEKERVIKGTSKTFGVANVTVPDKTIKIGYEDFVKDAFMSALDESNDSFSIDKFKEVFWDPCIELHIG
jgi:hypothetical protein